MASTPLLFVFDCDGTLADSQFIIGEAMRFAFQSMKLAVPDRAAVMRTVGLSLDDAVFALAPQERDSIREDVVRAYRERYLALRLADAREPLFPGAVSLLHRLAEHENVVLGIATGKSRRGVLGILEQNGLGGMFSTIQTADDAPSKPHPAMLFQAMTETGASPRTTVMIGDTSHDMLMAASANVTGIGVTWGYHSKAELRRAGAAKVVHSFAELGAIIEAGSVFAPFCRAMA